MVTSNGKLTDETFHPTTNRESCRVTVCLVGFAAVFLCSIHWRGASKSAGATRAELCSRASGSAAGDRELTVLYTASQLGLSHRQWQAWQSDPQPVSSQFHLGPSASLLQKRIAYRPPLVRINGTKKKKKINDNKGRPSIAKRPLGRIGYTLYTLIKRLVSRFWRYCLAWIRTIFKGKCGLGLYLQAAFKCISNVGVLRHWQINLK